MFSSSTTKPLQNPKDNKSSPTSSTTTTFPINPTSIYNTTVSIKLDEENFLIWRQLVEPIIKGHMLYKFLTGPAFDHNAESDNCYEEDQILLSWILSTISESMLTRVLGCKNSMQLWDEINNFFKTRARAKAKQLQSQLQNITKINTESISDYLLRIKILKDSLNFAEKPINLKEHIDAILKGLPEEYDALVTSINTISVADSCTIREIEYMLLNHEARIEEKNKVQDNDNDLDEADSRSSLSFNNMFLRPSQLLPPPTPSPSPQARAPYFSSQQHPNLQEIIQSNAAGSSSYRYSNPVWSSSSQPSIFSFEVPMNMRSPTMAMPQSSPPPPPPPPPLPQLYSRPIDPVPPLTYSSALAQCTAELINSVQ